MLFGTKSAEFLSDYPLEESVERLSAVVKRSVFSALTKQKLVGKISPSKVSVQRCIPFFGNSFKPFFMGSFEIKDGKVVLSGKFTIHPFIKVFTTLWFGFCIFSMLLGIKAFFGKNPENALMALGGVGFMLFGFGLIRFGRWISRSDVAWISTKISGALSSRTEAEGVTNVQDSRNWLVRNWKVAVPVGFVLIATLVIIFISLVMALLKSSSAYTNALALAKSNPEVISAIGEPIKGEFFVSGNIHVSNSSGNADLVIPISGPKGKATLYVRAMKSGSEWEFVTLEVIVDKNDKRVNLLIHK